MKRRVWIARDLHSNRVRVSGERPVRHEDVNAKFLHSGARGPTYHSLYYSMPSALVDVPVGEFERRTGIVVSPGECLSVVIDVDPLREVSI